MNNRQELIKLKILIVDDQPINHELLNGMLRDAGYSRINDIIDSRQAVAAYESFSPDLVILDLNMPHMDGFEVMSQIIEMDEESHAPILVLTSETDQDFRVRALKAGASDFLNKPFDFVEGLTRVESLLSIRWMYNQLLAQNKNLDQLVNERTAELRLESQSRIEAERKNIFMAMHDVRTGFPNRVMLENYMQDLTDKNGVDNYSLVVVSLDRFHEINHTLGYQNGSKLLLDVSSRLNDIASAEDFAVIEKNEESRREYSIVVLEGVNFGMILFGEGYEISGDEAIPPKFDKLISKIQSVMQEPFDFQGMSLDIGAHTGIATYPFHGQTPSELLQHAHIALELAQVSTSQFAFYSPSVDPYSARRLSLMGELRTAIDNDLLKMAYQPQINVSQRKVMGVEALLRWQHEELGFIPPDEFIPLAEQTGVIKPLTRWVLNTSIKQCSDFLKSNKSIKVGINLSARNLQEEGLVEYLQTLIEEYSVPAEMLVLEITESAMMADREKALEILSSLDKKGFRLSIDDFGTGYSSLAYLRQLPVKEIKIDRSFVMDMINQKDDLMIVRTTIDMSHNLGLEVVAEGVEDVESLDQLKDFGCDLAQGYYMCRPVPPADLENWLKESEWEVDPYKE
ncbi:MAG: EAL domain-containing protein [Gammaproteobacteria bacterium]|nr:MAG: EAL domain-containing protein [Gammaproteobacteria bacterium]